jgi:hypothetical protein
MADLDAVLEQLRQERKRAEVELRELDKVIADLCKAKMRTQAALRSSTNKKSRLSAAAKERIAAAQRARWAKARAEKKPG